MIQLVASVTSDVEEGTIDVPTSGVSKAVLKARIERLDKSNLCGYCASSICHLHEVG